METLNRIFWLVMDVKLDFSSIYGFYKSEIVSPLVLPIVSPFIPKSWENLDWLAYLLAAVTISFIVINTVMVAAAFYTWFERRTLGRFQSRLGPNRWGPFGLFQPIADGIKLLTKEDIVPETADKPIFHLAPLVLMVPGFLVFAVIPFGDDSFLGRLNVGVLFILAVTGVNTFGIFMGGWASRNKYAMFGAMRAVAMLISYEIPMALSLVGVVILTNAMSVPELLDGGHAVSALSLIGIVEAQEVIFFLVQPLGFLVFMTAASAEMSRAPFDMIEAESELGAGYHSEYSGVKFSMFQLAEFLAPIAVSTVATVVFLGGTRGFSPVPGQIWFLLKVLGLLFFLLWIRATWPRLRVDQIMGFAWKGLFPLALVNIFLIAIEVYSFQDPDTGRITPDALWTMAAINWVVTIVSIVVLANLLGQRKLRRPKPVPSPLANMNAEAD